MKRLRPLLVMLAIAAMLLVGMAVQIARNRAHQQPLGSPTMGQRLR